MIPSGFLVDSQTRPRSQRKPIPFSRTPQRDIRRELRHFHVKQFHRAKSFGTLMWNIVAFGLHSAGQRVGNLPMVRAAKIPVPNGSLKVFAKEG